MNGLLEDSGDTEIDAAMCCGVFHFLFDVV